MDLSSRYLGFHLPHPLLLGASPLVDDLDLVRRVEDAGASAIVMHSVFEEQIDAREQAGPDRNHESSEKTRYFPPNRSDFQLDANEYLEQLRRVRAAVDIPVIASLNGVGDGRWLDYARLLDQAGAHALELNVYRLATQPELRGEQLEDELISMLRHVKERTPIPVAVKLSPFHSALANVATRLVAAGADGLVLFNRFYQPDIDLERLEVRQQLELSTPAELPLRLRWLAVLSAQIQQTLGVSGGVHSALDVLKCVAVGADGVQLVSAVMARGPRVFSEMQSALTRWLEAHEYDSLAQLRDRLNLSHCPDGAAYERANYLHLLRAGSRLTAAHRPGPRPRR